jgi:hypothetical protein
MGPMYHTYRTPPRAARVRQGAVLARGGERVAQRDVVRLTWWLPEGAPAAAQPRANERDMRQHVTLFPPCAQHHKLQARDRR